MANPNGVGGWLPGRSGNPGGRPAVARNIQELARQHGPDAIAALVAALGSPRERVAAATVLLDRGFGRPPIMPDGRGMEDEATRERRQKVRAEVIEMLQRMAVPEPLLVDGESETDR